MTVNADITEQARLYDILDFWHRLEFFVPFNLDQRVENNENKKVSWLNSDRLDQDLVKILAYCPPVGKRISRVTLFLAVFDISELDIMIQKIAPTPEGTDAFENDERGLSDGRTCFAEFDLTQALSLNMESIKVSTLPWAMGRCLSEGLVSLDNATFQNSLMRLKDRLRGLGNMGCGNEAGQVDVKTIRMLFDELCEWADYRPDGSNPLACIEFTLARQEERVADAEPQNSKSSSETKDETPEIDEDDESLPEPEIGILNSFYIDDLESAMEEVRHGRPSALIRQYLTPVAPKERVDLYDDMGGNVLSETLHPARTNTGRWLSDPSHAMSLMQQFAINNVIRLRENSGLFSVNGPPGTGKTTLLRDIIADNLVARAKVLARYSNAGDAFEPEKRKYEFSDGSCTISMLKPELAGFGMVVASSNNAAVENISRDLPKRVAIIAPEDFGYLQTVSHKIAAQKHDGKFNKLYEGDVPWGMISCALGNSTNRRNFVDKFFFNKIERDDPVTWAGPNRPQSIWEWRRTYDGPRFKEAAYAFNQLQEEVDREIKKMVRFADLCADLAGQTEQSFVGEARNVLSQSLRVYDLAVDAEEIGDQDAARIKGLLEDLVEDERLLNLSAPVWWARLLPLKVGREYRAAMSDNATRQIEIRKHLREANDRLEQALKPKRHKAELALAKAKAAVSEAYESWRQKNAERDELQNCGFKEPSVNFDQDATQIAGLWHNDRLAGMRSKLTQAALTLHEAWLAEVSKNSAGFGGNLVAISKMLGGKLPEDPLPIWESLFMIVPVVSTTFASFSRQFQGMGAESLGWLFIDEAGQAVPQAAVGALARAKRAVVIGDPLQIEPVFNLPLGLLTALEKLTPATASGVWSPHRTSVQVLADAANPYGVSVAGLQKDEPMWIGSPLRVHRRCIDPMFSLANRIAYHDKMVFGLKEREPAGDVAPYLGRSAWIEVAGQVQGEQKVPEQIAFIQKLIKAIYARDDALPPIYIISPFKEIALALRQELTEIDWPGAAPKKEMLNKWLKSRVGTVHTFQGKEEDTVLMVLGADAARAGAAKWASSKPNLLNVALTRAKRRFYIVGERALWQQMQGFNKVVKALPVVQPDEFISSISPAANASQLGV